MYYSSFGTLSLIVLLIINLDVLRAKSTLGASPVKIRYKMFLVSISIFFATDILWGLFYQWKIVPLVYFDTVVYFAAMGAALFMWTRFVIDYLNEKNYFSTALYYTGWLILVFQALAVTVNFFVPFVFYFDENGVYRAGVGRNITFAVQFAMFTAIAVYTLAAAAKTAGKEKLHHRAIGFSGIVMSGFVVLQIFNELLPFFSVGCMIATCLIHTFVAEDEKKDQYSALGSAKHKAYTDSLTGVKNVHAYTEEKKRLDQRIADGTLYDFGVIVFDLNGLKRVNDTLGHDAGDRYIVDGCKQICRVFKRSPVFRIGGDEFVVLLEGLDYDDRTALLNSFDRQMDNNMKNGLVSVSGGMSEYIPGSDSDFNDIFERADHRMYARKKAMKAER